MDSYKFNNRKECKYFPCHKTNKPEEFNCMFCYCPLYTLGDKCGGNFSYTENGIKNCTDCILPHIKDVGYEHILKKMPLILEMAKKK